MEWSKDVENFAIIEHVSEQSTQAFFIYDVKANNFRYLNAAFEKIWQRSRDSILKDHTAIIATLYGEDRQFLEEKYEQLLDQQQVKSIEFRIVLPDKSLRWICLTAYLILKDSGESLIAGYTEDIHKEKEYINNVQKFTAKKNAVLEILSHDLASPLNTIQGITSLIEHKIKKGEYDSVGELLSFIKESCKKGTDLIRDFVDGEFLESSQVELTKTRIDIVKKIASIIDNYRTGQELLSKQFAITSSQDSIYIEVDEMKFMQVINNLLSNAIKFTHDEGKIAVHIEDQQESTLITIQDNGIGIPKDVQPKLFDKFTKARRPGIKGEKTTGLGMSIIKTIVEWHHGRIWFESVENKGTSFYIELPKK